MPPHNNLVLKRILQKHTKTMEVGIAEDALREIDVYSRIVHPNLLCLNDLVVEKDKLAMVLPLADLGDLHDYMHKNHETLSYAVLKAIAAQVVRGTKVIHDNGIVHLDMKPGNILAF